MCKDKGSSLFCSAFSDEEKLKNSKIATVFLVIDKAAKKSECLSLHIFFKILYIMSKPRAYQSEAPCSALLFALADVQGQTL